eukprot:TRINITY_DN2072_c0_g1_i1.p1 TRINITY_DN2072_c0_g1~~TRINITY_DN2072_c0_g1_i1.p1  ORF type:complete len:345 (-),score=103.97 TRINITY_DN2072_c0_g1_i1:51-1085(-)
MAKAEKPKTAGSGLFDQVKQDMKKEMMSAGIEQIYTKGKMTGKFNHPKEVEEQIEIMRQNREEIPVLREKISGKLKREKDVADAETQLAKDFKQMAEHPDQHPKLKQLLEQVADLNNAIAANRFNMHAQMGIVNEEWKKWETNALKEIRFKQDQLNHCWCEMKFWKKKDTAKYGECESRYRILTADFVSLIHDIRKKKETDIPTWLLSCVQYELEFFTNAIPHIANIEQAIRSMGPVQAIEHPGMERFMLQAAEPVVPALTYNVTPNYTAPAPQETYAAAAPVAPQSSNKKARALYDFDSPEPGDLPFKAGEEISIISDAGSGWLNGMNAAGRTGLVPANYVQQ